MEWYIKVLKNYFGFSGRAKRKECWVFMLVNLIISFFLSFIDVMLEMALLNSVYLLAIIVPSLAVLIRRLHDTSRSGWWALLLLVPLIGAIVILVFTIQDSKLGDNQFGPNPKTASDELVLEK